MINTKYSHPTNNSAKDEINVRWKVVSDPQSLPPLLWKKRKTMPIARYNNTTNPISKAYYSNVIFQSSWQMLFVITWFLLLSLTAAQLTTSNGVSSGGGRFGPSQTNIRQNDNLYTLYPEGFFYAMNGSSYAVISDTILSDTSSGHFGLSFRTCTPGNLLKQIGDNSDELKLDLSEEDGGKLHFSLTAASGDYTVSKSIGSGLLDAKWHTVLLQVSPSNDQITISIPGTPNTNVSNNGMSTDGGDTVTISGDELGDILNVLDLHSASPQLNVGAGLVGCIREGPGVRFSKQGITVNSAFVKWGHGENCLLPYKCSGKRRNHNN